MIPTYKINPQKITQPVTLESLWLNVIMADPVYWFKQFRKMESMNIKNILLNQRGTLPEKLNKIFGSKYKELFPNADKMKVSLQVLGDIFEDIGNFFSEKNLNDWEAQLRKGSNIGNQIANAFNYFKNSGSLNQQVQQQQKIQDIQTKTLTTAQNIWSTYSLPIAIGGGLLIVMLLMKK